MTELNVNGNQIQEKVKLKQSEETAKQVASDPAAQNPEVRAAKADLKMKDTAPVRDMFKRTVKSNGITEKIYDAAKNMSGLGIGSKKLEAVVKKYEDGEISEDEAVDTIKKYESSQKNSVELVGDATSIAAAGGMFFSILPPALIKETYNIIAAINKGTANPEKVEILLKKLNKESWIKKWMPNWIKGQIDLTSKVMSFAQKFDPKSAKEAVNSKGSKGVVMALTMAAIAGASVKPIVNMISRLGSKEFQVDKADYNGARTKEDLKAFREEKRARTKDKYKAFFVRNIKDSISGAINGAMMPVTLLGGGFIGVPLYLAGNLINRYFIGSNEEDKSFEGFVQSLKTNVVENAAFAVPAGILLGMQAHDTKALAKNLKQVQDRLKNQMVKYTAAANPTQEITTILNEAMSDRVTRGTLNLRYDCSGRDKEIIAENARLICEDNIIAAKFFQTAAKEKSSGFLEMLCTGNISGIQKSGEFNNAIRALAENVEPSRTIGEAQSVINGIKGYENYVVEKCLGSATVAETYLVKDGNGKKHCIKMIRRGLTKEKIAKDLDACKSMIDSTCVGEKAGQKDALKKKLTEYSKTLEQELDLANEFNNAQELAKATQSALVVKPEAVAKAADGTQIYMMEVADGVSVESFCKLVNACALEDDKTKLTAIVLTNANAARSETLDQITNRMPISIQEANELKDKIKNMTSDDIEFLYKEYKKVVVDQFGNVPQGGKVIHADIHKGNIFINFDALKNREEGKVFTLIDTGNVIRVSEKKAQNALKLSICIQKGDTEGIAKHIVSALQDSEIPQGKTRADIQKFLNDELKKIFFEGKYKLDFTSNESIIEIADTILQKQGIHGSQIQQLQYTKAYLSALSSGSEIVDSIKIQDASEGITKAYGSKEKNNTYEDEIRNIHAMMQHQKAKEASEQLVKESLSGSQPAENSVDYLTYLYKQAL